MFGTSLPAELERVKEEIKGYALDFGLDFFETIFEMIDYKQVNEVASLGGFPTRYPHWRFGMEYDRLSKSYEYGLHKIYEMVINNDPCYAYLLRSNRFVDQKLVIGHVYAHCDFFKCNMSFASTNRKMMDEMANHATRVRNYMDRFGVESVEDFIDRCLSIENLIDYHASNMKVRMEQGDGTEAQQEVRKLKSKPYMDKYINPDEFLDEQRRKMNEQHEKQRKFPPKPEKDVLLFLQEYGPLNSWQSDVLSIIREEAYYFAPQGQTKIMNEGWASFWHSRIMTEKAMKDSEIVDFADHHSGTVYMRPGSLNPYKLGLELFRDIEERWNKGQFGKEWEECDDYLVKQSWDKKLGLGRQKIFEIRRFYNDVSFIDAFITPEFCIKYKLFTYDVNERSNQWEITSRAFREVKNKLLFSLTNFGQPFIYVEDGNYKNRGELLLWHKHEGFDLKIGEAKKTLENVQAVWGRTVNLRTLVDNKEVIFTFDGKEHTEQS